MLTKIGLSWRLTSPAPPKPANSSSPLANPQPPIKLANNFLRPRAPIRPRPGRLRPESLSRPQIPRHPKYCSRGCPLGRRAGGQHADGPRLRRQQDAEGRRRGCRQSPGEADGAGGNGPDQPVGCRPAGDWGAGNVLSQVCGWGLGARGRLWRVGGLGQRSRELRRELGEGFAIVTPGVRPAGSAVGDQARVVTPAELSPRARPIWSSEGRSSRQRIRRRQRRRLWQRLKPYAVTSSQRDNPTQERAAFTIFAVVTPCPVWRWV